ncbi:MAG TPA: selenocysteine-specific translation elongation factor, partial [Steroidobacteraceae bacterium]|nr:selenocysteine-specific translation elongation factor [Steroidobacteraceae bacterium]
MIVGTAGHIDHGKTTLVRALTGVDTDRLKEEKARGISIELGYAYTPLAGGEVLGFIDVPGHERLVHTMVAGACGIDFALLVVAADDGVMPQTREHLAILGLLGITRGAVALTKIDRVDAKRAGEAEAEVRAALAATPFRDASLFALDALDAAHPGVAALRQHLAAAAAATAAREDGRLFRLAVDRVFTLAGHGTVVTGTVFSGCVRTGDTLALVPAGRPARVRSIHVQNQPAELGRAGQRCALNLAGLERSAIARGDWLADPRLCGAGTRLDARLELLSGSGARLEAWSPLHVHLGTTHRLAHAVPLESARLAAGERGPVQLVFESPVFAMPGDRLIVRDARARHTIGGGVVLDPAAPARRRRSAQRHRYLSALERLVAGDGIGALLACTPYGVTVSELTRITGRAADDIALPEGTLTIAAGAERFVLLPQSWQALCAGALAALGRFHEEVPDEPGPDGGRLRRMSFPDAPAALWQALIAELLREGRLARSGAWLHLPAHVAVLSADDALLARRLEPLLRAGRFDPPWVRELAAAVHESEERVRTVLRKQVARGGAYQVVRDLFYAREHIAELAGIIDACT